MSQWIVRYHVSRSFAKASATLESWPRSYDEGPFKRRITAVRKARQARKDRAEFWDMDYSPGVVGMPPEEQVVDYGPSYAKVEVIEVPE